MSHIPAAPSPAGRLWPPDPREPQHWKHTVGQHRGGVWWVKLADETKSVMSLRQIESTSGTKWAHNCQKMSHSRLAATVLGKTKQKPACGHSGGNPPWLPPTALFPTEAVVTVESVCDALSNGGAIDLWRRRLSPLAWPWLGEQIDADRQKPDLDPLYVTSAGVWGGDCPPPSTRPRPTLTDTSSAPRWPILWLLWLLRYFADPSPAVKVKWGVGTFRLKPVCTLGLTQFVTWLGTRKFCRPLRASLQSISFFSSSSLCLHISLFSLFWPFYIFNFLFLLF